MANDQSLVIRDATLGDAIPLFELQRRSALTAFKHIFPPADYPFPDEEEREHWAEILHRPDMSVLVVERRKPIGVAAVHRKELLRFFVTPEEWGHGTANALHAAVIRLLQSRGEEACMLWVLEANHRARRFYERRGWRLDGRRKDARFPPFPPAVGYTLRLHSVFPYRVGTGG